MEQGTRLDSTRMSAAQDVRDDIGPDRGLDAAVAALLITPTRNTAEGRAQTARAPLPEPGSPEAKAMFHAACTETDLLSRAAVHGYPELDRAPFGSWTRRDLLRAMETGEITPSEYARLHPLAFERELRINAAALATNVGALQAVAYADDFTREAEAVRAEAEAGADPILAAIGETRRLCGAVRTASDLPQPKGMLGPLPQQVESMAALAAYIDDVLLKTVPTTGAGCAALARYADEFMKTEGYVLDEEAHEHLRILGLIARSPLVQQPLSLSPVPAGTADNTGFIAYEDAAGQVRRGSVEQWVRFTTTRLFSLAQEEMARQLGAPDLADEERDALTTKLRRDLRFDALHIAAFRPGAAFDAAKEAECGSGPPPKVSPIGSVSAELYRAVEAHREARQLMLRDPISDDDRTAAHVTRIKALGDIVRAAPVRSLADLRHKVIYLWPGPLVGEVADSELADTFDSFRLDVMQMAKAGQGLLTGLDPKAMPMRTLDALCDHARTLANVCYGLAAQPRSSGSDENLNEAGTVMLRLAEEVLGQVIDTCENEAKRRSDVSGQDRIVRAGMLARPIIEDEDPSKLRAFAGDLVAMAEV